MVGFPKWNRFPGWPILVKGQRDREDGAASGVRLDFSIRYRLEIEM